MKRAVVTVSGLLLAFLASSPPARATDFYPKDATDNTNRNNSCSFREALNASNTNTCVDNCGCGSGADTIYLAAGQTYVISSPLLINDHTVIQGVVGSRATIKPAANTNIAGIYVAQHLTVEIDEVIITGFRGPAVFGDFDSGVYLYHDEVKGNQLTTGNGQNASLATKGYMEVYNCAVHDNIQNIKGGGAWIGPGAYMDIGGGSQIYANQANQYGGGIMNLGTLYCWDNTSISNNTANMIGGGVYSASGATLFNYCNISGNHAPKDPDIHQDP